MNWAPHNLRLAKSPVRFESAAGTAVASPTPQFVVADVSQHCAIYDLLHTTYPAYSLEEFAAWLEEPAYDPADRVLLFLGSELAGHAHVVMRYANFAGVRLPVALIREFALRCEFDCEELQSGLLSRAALAASERGAVVALLAGREFSPRPSDQWHPLPSQGYSAADPQEVLSRLGDFARYGSRADRGVRVGLFRRMDLDGLMAIYAADSIRKWGTIVRNEPYWQWLLARETHDASLVVTAGRARLRMHNGRPSLAGYAIAKRNHIFEVVPAEGDGGKRLLSRLCRDAVERGDHTLTLHTPADDPLHQTMFAAEGDWCDKARDGIRPVWCKLLDRARWIEALFPVWRQRAREHRVTPPCTLSIELPDRRCEFLLSRRSAHWCDDASYRVAADIACDCATLGAILVGHESWQTARDAGRLGLAKRQAATVLSALFSPRLWHFTLLDWL